MAPPGAQPMIKLRYSKTAVVDTWIS